MAQRRAILAVLQRVMVAWVCFGTDVLHADDSAVSPAPQLDAPAVSRHAGARGRQRLDWERPPPLAEPMRPRARYTGWLVVSYLAAPVLIVGVPFAMTELIRDNGLATAIAIPTALAMGLVLPAIVHFNHGERELGRRSLGLFPALVAAGVVTGFFAGLGMGDSAGSDGDGDSVVTYGLTGALIGAGLAGAVWAVFDVLDTTRKPIRRANAGPRLHLAIVPTSGGALGLLAGAF
jgi:hypothetical protein